MAEGVACREEMLDEVISASQGDLRKAITLLQSASHLKGSEEITGQDILEIAGVSCTELSSSRFIIIAYTLGGA